MRTSGPAKVLAAAALLAVTAGCSASASSSTGQAGGTAGATTPAAGQGAGTSVSSGHDTPQDAVSGVSAAELAGNWPLVCTFWMPAQQATCKNMKPAAKPTGKVTVGGTVVSGDLALVGVTGKVCFTGNHCQGNTDPVAGMPTGSLTFKQAYDKDLNGTAFSPVPCIRVNGKWYINTSTV
jgi:hypothetical protein